MSYDTTLLNQVLTKANALLDHYSQNPSATALSAQEIENNHVFRWVAPQYASPIQCQHTLKTSDLLFVNYQASALRNNTQQFLQGLPANNCLLWGARGTGKSSLLKSVIAEFIGSNLKVIEINREDFHYWPTIVEWIAKQNNKFIIYCDDLSFDEHDSSYKSAKAALDGSLSSLPENALMYATSNRRHLLPEFMRDNHKAEHINTEVHHNEAVEEAISLSDRFGLWLSFHAMTQDQYLSLVTHWLDQFNIKQSEQEYREEALRWALQRGSRSGRIANQFARHYAGKLLMDKN